MWNKNGNGSSKLSFLGLLSFGGTSLFLKLSASIATGHLEVRACLGRRFFKREPVESRSTLIIGSSKVLGKEWKCCAHLNGLGRFRAVLCIFFLPCVRHSFVLLNHPLSTI